MNNPNEVGAVKGFRSFRRHNTQGNGGRGGVTYPEITISRCQSQARTKNFICNDCKWSKYPNKQQTYCTKPGSLSNGEQYAPVNWCVEFELKDI